MEVTEADGPSILSKIVAVLVMQGWNRHGQGLGRSRGGESKIHTTYIRKQAVAASSSNQQRVYSATENPGDVSSNPGGSASRRKKSVLKGAEGVLEDAGAEGWMLTSAKRMLRRQRW
jgi:hypothetical protein